MDKDRSRQNNKMELLMWIAVPMILVLFFVLVPGFEWIGKWILFSFPEIDILQSKSADWIVNQTAMLFAAFCTAIATFWMTRRPLSDLGLPWHLKELFGGSLMAFMLYAVGFSISLLCNWVNINGYTLDLKTLSWTLLLFVIVSYTEEILVRGCILSTLLQTSIHKWMAVLLSSLIFACLHLFNPNIEFLPIINLVLAGMLLGMGYLYTRNLSFSLSLHLFWNWIQGPILGYQVSGNEFSSTFLKLQVSDQYLWNGGAFGFEGSLLCTFLMLISLIGIVWWGEKKDAIHLVAPQSN